MTYNFFYPSDSFYYNEFKRITEVNAPKSSKIIKKSSTYPDIHGDYKSEALIELSFIDYEDLLYILKNSSYMVEVNENKSKEIINGLDYDIIEGINQIESNFVFYNKKSKETEIYQIYFLKDKKSIIIKFWSS